MIQISWDGMIAGRKTPVTGNCHRLRSAVRGYLAARTRQIVATASGSTGRDHNGRDECRLGLDDIRVLEV
jgi:hypothetical protein